VRGPSFQQPELKVRTAPELQSRGRRAMRARWGAGLVAPALRRDQRDELGRGLGLKGASRSFLRRATQGGWCGTCGAPEMKNPPGGGQAGTGDWSIDAKD